MKIVFWPSQYLPAIGGLEILTHSLAMQLQKMGHEILIITDHAGSSLSDNRTIDGIQVISLPFSTALNFYDVKKIKELMSQMEHILQTFSPDLVNIHGWYETLAFYQLRLLKNIPFYLTIHGLLEQETYATHACQLLWTRAQGINTVSCSLKETLFSRKWTHPSLRVIHNGLASGRFSKQVKPKDPNRLVMIGRLSPEKGFDIGFQALKILQTTYPQAILSLVGGGALWDSLVRLRNTLQLDASIEMTGFVQPNQVAHYIDQASLVLIPSSYESFGLVALEAAFRGRPVIASHVHGLKEVVVHQETGWLIKPGCPSSLAHAIDRLWSHPEIMEDMEFASKQRAAQFTIEACAQNYLNMYQNV